MEATIYYLNWDKEAKERLENDDIDGHPAMGPVGELKHKLDVEEVLDEDEKPSKSYSDEFEEFYREVTSVEGYSEDDLGQLWKEWNAGSREESQEFYESEERSMCVGDVIEIDGSYYQVQNAGFEEIEIRGETR